MMNQGNRANHRPRIQPAPEQQPIATASFTRTLRNLRNTLLLTLWLFCGAGIAQAQDGMADPAVFDAKYYLHLYPDLRAAFGKDEQKAKAHWLTWGINEGRRGSPKFDPKFYLNNNSDVKRAYPASQLYYFASNHYLRFGRYEPRETFYEVPEGLYRITTKPTGKCLGIEDVSQKVGALLKQYDCSGKSNQLWSLKKTADGYYRITAAHSGKNLRVQNGSSADLTPIIQSTTASDGSDEFKLLPLGEAYYNLIAKHSQMALDVAYDSRQDGGQIIQGYLYEGANQQFKLERVACNGVPEICGLKLNEATFAGSHNSASGYRGLLYHWSGGAAGSHYYRNQGESFTGQLDRGVRYFDIDTTWVEPATGYSDWWSPQGAWMGHGGGSSAYAYAGPVQHLVNQVDDWLEAHPYEVAVIHFNGDIYDTAHAWLNKSGGQTDSDVTRASIARDILRMLDEKWAPNKDGNLAMIEKVSGDWPTLAEAIKKNQRVLILMSNKLGGNNGLSYIHSDSLMGTSWDSFGVTYSCSQAETNAENKCSAANEEFMEVQVVGAYGLLVQDIASVCAKSIRQAATNCRDKRVEKSKTANFIIADWVDYAGVGSNNNVFDVARELNAENIKRAKLGNTQYKITVETGDRYRAGTDSDIYLTLAGDAGVITEFHLNPYDGFDTGQAKEFNRVETDLGGLTKLTLRGGADQWFCSTITITKGDNQSYVFPVNRWIDSGNHTFYVSP